MGKATGGLVQQRFGKSGGSVLRMTVFRKFEVCASYEHLWLNRHLRQAAKRYSVIGASYVLFAQ